MGMGQTTQMMIKKIKDLQMKLNPKKEVMNPKMVVVNLMVMKNLKKVVRTQVMVVSNQMKVVRDPKKVVMKKVKATPPQHQHHQHSPVGIYHQLKNQEHQMMMKNAYSHARHHFHHQHYHLVMGYQNLTLSPAVSPACHPYPSIIVILRYGPLKKWTNLQPI